MFMESCFAFLTEKRIRRLVVIFLEARVPSEKIEKYHGMTPTEIGSVDVQGRFKV
jgi:hypothetical protein